ncbi:MAG: cupin domain-containing protein [Gammaproteobacteria bacterium]|nr:cupin domain-containing protein [Gammaproteobacteria bacterium]
MIKTLSQSAVLAPVKIDQFLQQYWEDQTLHIQRSDTHFFDSYLSLGSYMSAFDSAELRYPDVQLTQHSKQIDKHQYSDTSNNIVRDQAWALHEAGASIVWAHAHKSISGLQELCRNTTASLMLPSQANVYYSPPGFQGFNAHYDSHDVFILQISGQKTFRLYENNLLLPFSEERFSKQEHSAGAIVEELVLNAGDTLYIPRGVFHDAIASDDVASLHVTLGVYAQTKADLVHRLFDLTVAKNPRWRESIPVRFDDQAGGVDVTDDWLEPAELSAIAPPELVQRAYSSLHDDVALDSADLADTALQNATPIQAIGVDDGIRVQIGSVLNWEASESSVRLRLFGRVIEFNDPLAGGVDWLLSEAGKDTEKVFYPHEIPDLTNEQRIALCMQLIHEYVIFTV